MAKLKEELGVKLEKMLHVFVFCQEAYLYTEYFHNPATKEELDLLISSPHASEFGVIRHLMFRTLISEVSKLFSKSENDKFRLDKFIKSLSKSGRYKAFNISNNHIERWEKKLLASQETIDNILLLRSKLYAHTDDPMTSYNHIDISFKNLKELLDLAGSILKDVYKDVFNTGLMLDSPTFDRKRFTMLRLLAKVEKDRVQEIFKKYSRG